MTKTFFISCFEKILVRSFLCTIIFIGCAQNKLSAQRIAFLTDVHVGPGLESEAGLKRIVEEINAGDFIFAIITGDLTNNGTDAELESVHSILKGLTIPFYAIPGNHETNWSESACQTFNRLFGDDKVYFEWGDFRFIGYSTGPYMKMGDGNIRKEDLRWITQTLTRNPSKTLISLSHYPLSDGLDNWKQITAILKNNNARAALCGHGHRLSLHNFSGIPGIMGRSSLSRGKIAEGYNIIELRNDSMLVFSKAIGSSVEPFIGFSLKDTAVLNGKASTPEIDFSVNNSYPNALPIYSFADTASIFTGVIPVNDKMVVYGTSTGELIALNPRNGKTHWRKQFTGSIYGTPVLAEGVIVTGNSDGKVTGIKARNGKTLWSVQNSEPVIADGISEGKMVYLGVGSKSFYKIDATNGKIIWKNDSVSGQMQGKPALSGDNVVFGAWDRHLYCLNKQTGELQWKWNNGSPQKLYSPGNVVPAIVGQKVFIVAPDRYMTAIDLKTGKTIWRNNQHRVRESMTVAEDGSEVYAKLMNDSIIAVSTSAEQFEMNWAVNAGFGYEHNPCPMLSHNGMVYAGTKNGVLVAVNTREGKLAWKHKSGNSSVNKIIPDQKGNIWISLIEGKILQYKHQITPN